MSTYTLAFLGTGNMGSALARAACTAIPAGEILLANRTAAKAEALAADLGCAVGTNQSAAAQGKFLFLGVKPQMMAGLLAEIAPTLAQRQEPPILVSMAAGLTMAQIAQMAGGAYPVIRIMPNTPCAVGAGILLYDANGLVAEADLAQFTAAMAGAGLLDRLEEHLMDAGSAVAGCGPAFLYPLIEALADGGVKVGLPRKQAMVYAAQMVLGSAAMVLESGKHPGQLKDEVCSPGGSTIAGVAALEARGFRSAAIEAVEAAYRRNVELGKV